MSDTTTTSLESSGLHNPPRHRSAEIQMLDGMLQYAEQLCFAVRECPDADAIVVNTAPILWATGLELTGADDPYEKGVGYILALHALLRAPEALTAAAANLCVAIAEHMHAADMDGDMAILALLNASLTGWPNPGAQLRPAAEGGA